MVRVLSCVLSTGDDGLGEWYFSGFDAAEDEPEDAWFPLELSVCLVGDFEDGHALESVVDDLPVGLLAAADEFGS